MAQATLLTELNALLQRFKVVDIVGLRNFFQLRKRDVEADAVRYHVRGLNQSECCQV